MWQGNWRETLWSDLDQPWDLIVIGGGITGAGILREAARAGLRALLVEQHDFAAGTSSRSSKLVHGGLRYLKNAQVRLTYESIRERERLLRDGYGLIDPLRFLMADYEHDRMPGWVMAAGLMAYDLMALKWDHATLSAESVHQLAPDLLRDTLEGGFVYTDAKTDDARLVLRVLREAVQSGGVAINYVCAVDLLRDNGGQVRGVALRDEAPGRHGRTTEVRADVVINATGAWADDLRRKLGQERRIRPLQGSHLTFSAERLPLQQAVSFMHPVDRRPVFAIPWEGVTILGTTDVDHGDNVARDPAITPAEAEYLLDAARWAFPALDLAEADVIGTWAGVRPVIDTGKDDPSKESREHVLWHEDGLLTVTGGKLTTYRLMAQEALTAVRKQLPNRPRWDDDDPMFNPVSAAFALETGLDPARWKRLLGRLGSDIGPFLAMVDTAECEAVAGLPALWCELRWAARAEGVVRLEDLLLRRVRLGFTLPNGGLDQMERIRAIVQPELRWSDARWMAEENAYRALWQRSYAGLRQRQPA